MVPNTKQPTDVKVKIYEYPVILVKPSKWFEPIMEDFPLLSATKMVTLTGALIACPIQPPEYCRGSKLTCLPNDACHKPGHSRVQTHFSHRQTIHRHLLMK